MQAELSAALSSYRKLVNESALASYLVAANDAGESPGQVIEVAGWIHLTVTTPVPPPKH
ncbi:hypothetical protein D3C78_1988940 [compost metagenome]